MAHKVKCRVARRPKTRARAGKPKPMSKGQAKTQAKVKSRVKHQRHSQTPKHPKLKKRLKDHKAAGDRPRGCGDKPEPAEPSAAPGPAKRG